MRSRAAIWSCGAWPATARPERSSAVPNRGGRGEPTRSCFCGRRRATRVTNHRGVRMRKLNAVRSCMMGIAALLSCPPLMAQVENAQAGSMVEIRSYNLKPGTRDRFHQRFERDSLPLLRVHHVDVVAYGPSLHDADSWYLLRAYPSLAERQRS